MKKNRSIAALLLTLPVFFGMTACGDPGREREEPGVTETYLEQLQEKADGQKQSILQKPSEYEVGKGGTVYYVSSDGNVENDGRSRENPIRAEQVKNLPLQAGDVVLFKRGDLFRGMENVPLKSGVTYSAYGEGDKPVLCGSVRNYAQENLWATTQTEGVYVCTESFVNVGIVLFDGDFGTGNYTLDYGVMKFIGEDDFNSFGDFSEDGQFVFDRDEKKLYLYSPQGNPGERYESIEIGDEYSIFTTTGDNVTVDNLHFTLAGKHGISAGNVRNLTVKNCVFDWIGGSYFQKNRVLGNERYGNAVQVYGACDGYTVCDNWIYQIYDTAITHQYSQEGGASVAMDHIEYADNLIEYCLWGIEYYNVESYATELKAPTRTSKEVAIHDNFVRFSSMGWGSAGREHKVVRSALDLYFTGYEEGYTIENNIYDRAEGPLVAIKMYKGEKYEFGGDHVIFDKGDQYGYDMAGNVYVQYDGKPLISVNETEYSCDGNAVANVNEYLGDYRYRVVRVYEDGTALEVGGKK